MFKLLKEKRENKKWAKSLVGKPFYSPYFRKNLEVVEVKNSKIWWFKPWSMDLANDKLTLFPMRAGSDLSVFFDKRGVAREQYKPREVE